MSMNIVRAQVFALGATLLTPKWHPHENIVIMARKGDQPLRRLYSSKGDEAFHEEGPFTVQAPNNLVFSLTIPQWRIKDVVHINGENISNNVFYPISAGNNKIRHPPVFPVCSKEENIGPIPHYPSSLANKNSPIINDFPPKTSDKEISTPQNGPLDEKGARLRGHKEAPSTKYFHQDFSHKAIRLSKNIQAVISSKGLVEKRTSFYISQFILKRNLIYILSTNFKRNIRC